MAIVARWQYELDTSDDERYPFISYGQFLLRDDGALFQRVEHSGGHFGPWATSGPSNHGPYTAEAVEDTADWPASNYYLFRIKE